MRTLTLTVTKEVILDGTGAGTVQAGPSSPGETWLPAIITVGTAQTVITSQAQCRVYLGPDSSPPNYVDGTYSGSSGDSTGKAGIRTLFPGDYVFAVWAGGDPGAAAFMTITGTKTVP